MHTEKVSYFEMQNTLSKISAVKKMIYFETLESVDLIPSNSHIRKQVCQPFQNAVNKSLNTHYPIPQPILWAPLPIPMSLTLFCKTTACRPK